jgi:hypothetical protein
VWNPPQLISITLQQVASVDLQTLLIVVVCVCVLVVVVVCNTKKKITGFVGVERSV